MSTEQAHVIFVPTVSVGNLDATFATGCSDMLAIAHRSVLNLGRDAGLCSFSLN